MRLAAKFGVLKVDQLVDSLTKRELIEWKAVAVLDGWDDGKRHLSDIQAAIHNAANRIELAASTDKKATLDSLTWKSGWDFLKAKFNFKNRSNKQTGMMKPGQVLRQLEAKHGN